MKLPFLQFFTQTPKLTETKYSADEVEKYYEAFTDVYLETTGDFIQAYRSGDTDSLMEYLVGSMGLKNGMSVLDAGCGVCAPAIWIARHFPETTLTCITNSAKQYTIGNNKIRSAGLEERITLLHCDYHRLQTSCHHNAFDIIVFLESLGHNQDLDGVLRGANAVLKSGGLLYVKDFFRRYSQDPSRQKSIDEVIQVINRNYVYNVMNLPDLIECLSTNNFSLNYVRSPNISADLAITVAFENKAGRLTYPSFGKIRAVDWYEISAVCD